MKREEIPAPSPGHRKASAAVSAALGTLHYPIAKEEAIRQVGDWKVPYGQDAHVPLGQILGALPQEELQDPAAAAQAVDRYWARLSETLGKTGRQAKK